jgi:hypothetical protein
MKKRKENTHYEKPIKTQSNEPTPDCAWALDTKTGGLKGGVK